MNRAEYLLTRLIPAVQRELSGIPGVKTLLSRLRNEPWRGGRKEAAIFHAERALQYHREGKLVAIEQYQRVFGKRVFFDLTLMETVDATAEQRGVIVELKNWRGFSRWPEKTRGRRLVNLERQIRKYAAGGKFIRLEFKGFVPDEVANSHALKKLAAQGKLEFRTVP